ncbi:serine hydrolase domain-containing protein [Hymenobacter negativus]|uniref:Beta-lactamase n=1 Tax=Hymenobacter negativus TaxID=2795026 RepID=A0ABS3QF04_9BACT|nr:serine hydrolase domain-containing protein [Hymenobacter negativus]MBO2009829.1 serine hydrolase [Hymenobacter negativus]
MPAIRFLTLTSLLALTLGTAAGQVQTAPPADAKARMDTVVQRLGTAFMKQPGRVGLSIGILRNGQSYFYNFGTVEKGKAQVATQNTVYEIGSISKTFTSLLLAHAVLEKRVNLNDDIRKYLPGAYPNLAFGGQPIKLVHLANTTSRLPDNLPENLFRRANPDSVAFLAVKNMRGYTKQNFLADLHQARLDTVPGLLPRHSNVATQLLAYILESVYKTSCADLLARYINQPLHLAGPTGTGPKATGYDGKGTAMPNITIETALAAGGLRYTPADLVKYLQYQLAESDKAVVLAHQPTWGQLDEQAIGFNWNLEKTVDSKRTLQHSGGTFGYASYCELYPELKYGIVLLANESDENTQGSLGATAEQIKEALYGVPPALQALRQALAASNYDHAPDVVAAVKKKHPELHLTEDYVNTWGYRELRQGQPQRALALFQLNVSLFPKGWNTYDSLAETYESTGAKPQAIENYRRSLTLNPKNDNAVAHLRKLGAL